MVSDKDIGYIKDEEYANLGNIQDKASGWISELESYCRAKKRFALDKSNSVLLIIDCQSFFLDEKCHAFVPTSKAILPNIARLIEIARQNDMSVIYTRHALTDDEEPGIMGRWWGDVLRGSDTMSQIAPELQPEGDELVIRKSRYSAFKGTALASVLAGMRIRSIIVAGVQTHLCVESTCRDAFMQDLEVYAVVDATASDTEELHMSALRTLADGFAVPVTTSEIIEMMEIEEDDQ